MRDHGSRPRRGYLCRFCLLPSLSPSPGAGTAAELAEKSPPTLTKVGLFVNPDDRWLDAVTAKVELDYLQLHGTESPERIDAIRVRWGLPLIKAIHINTWNQPEEFREIEDIADMLLLDAPAANLPGGNGIPFDWNHLIGRNWHKPWILAGGLTPENVAEAIRRTDARQVDVSSGVESKPGEKNPDRIASFLRAAGVQPEVMP